MMIWPYSFSSQLLLSQFSLLNSFFSRPSMMRRKKKVMWRSACCLFFSSSFWFSRYLLIHKASISDGISSPSFRSARVHVRLLLCQAPAVSDPGRVVVPVSIIFSLTSSTISDLFLHLKPQGLKERTGIRKKCTHAKHAECVKRMFLPKKGFSTSFFHKEPEFFNHLRSSFTFFSAYWLREWKIISLSLSLSLPSSSSCSRERVFHERESSKGIIDPFPLFAFSCFTWRVCIWLNVRSIVIIIIIHLMPQTTLTEINGASVVG